MNNILILVNKFENSGPVRGASAVFKGILNKGENVFLVSVEKMPHKVNFLDVQSSNIFSLNSDNFFRLYRAHRSLKKIIKEKKIDIIISYGFRSNILSSLTSIKKIAVVMASCLKEALYLNYSPKIKAFFLSLMSYFFLGFHDGVIYASKEMIENDKNNYILKPKKFINLPINPIDENYVSEFSSKQELVAVDIESVFQNNSFVFCTISALNKRKNIGEMISIIGDLNENGYNISFLVIGSGEERKNLEDLVIKRRLENKVIFLGYLENPLSVLKKSHGFIMSSLSEGLPVAALESIFLGTPVLMPNLSGMSHFIPKNCGVIYQRENFKGEIVLFMNGVRNNDFNPKVPKELSQEYTANLYLEVIDNLCKTKVSQ